MSRKDLKTWKRQPVIFTRPGLEFWSICTEQKELVLRRPQLTPLYYYQNYILNGGLQGLGHGKSGECWLKSIQLSIMRWVTHGHLMYSMVTLVGKTVLFTWNLLRVDVKCPYHTHIYTKKVIVWWWMCWLIWLWWSLYNIKSSYWTPWIYTIFICKL